MTVTQSLSRAAMSARRLSVAIGMLGTMSLSAHADPAVKEFYIGTSPRQMYVQSWIPSERKSTPPVAIIMIHGGSHTGTTWTMPLDDTQGWAARFAREGQQVYVVDWPGVGRSGFWPETLDDGPGTILTALEGLLEQTGPAVLIGHSIGGALSFKLVERKPHLVRAVVALAPASVEIRNASVPPADPGKLLVQTREAVMQRFANSETFPKDKFDEYFRSLVPISSRIRNAAVGVTDDFKLDRTRLDIWKKLPVLFLVAEEDRTVPTSVGEETAKIMGVPMTFLGRDWKMPGHGHLYILEKGNDAIAARIQEWIAGNVK